MCGPKLKGGKAVIDWGIDCREKWMGRETVTYSVRCQVNQPRTEWFLILSEGMWIMAACLAGNNFSIGYQYMNYILLSTGLEYHEGGIGVGTG